MYLPEDAFCVAEFSTADSGVDVVWLEVVCSEEVVFISIQLVLQMINE